VEGNKEDRIFTERLLMRRLGIDDLDDFYAIMRKEEVVVWLGGSAGKTRDETRATIEKYAAQWEEKGYGVCGVFDRQTGELLGDCGLNFLKETDEVEVMYAFHPEYWGRGYATEAAAAAVEYAFKTARLDRIIVLSKADNARSKNVIRKLKFQPIGIKRYFGMDLLCYEMGRDSHF
jgi:ribosomal-protein-alanine N-acetyltransferase